ncbi:MAG: TIGR00269 family protein [DPANN group archaeon]|nr:TIGR00269 family protein [DPANN group archaeon]
MQVLKCNCGKDAVIYRKYEGRALCRKHFFESVESTIRKTIRQNSLIERHDKLCIALSGGKDSILTLYFLNKLFLKRDDLEIFAVIIDEGIKGYRNKSLVSSKKFCKEIGVKLHVASFKKEYGKTLDQIVSMRDSTKLKACTFCGVFRRDILNKTARKYGATKLVIGHNLDDESQSIMANYVRGDMLRQVRLGAKAFVIEDKRFIPRIKPLRNVLEKDTGLYVLLKGFDVDFGECPYASESFRWDMRDIINSLEDKYPGTKYSIVKSFDRTLPVFRKDFSGSEIATCKMCGEPASNEVCKVCILREKIK